MPAKSKPKSVKKSLRDIETVDAVIDDAMERILKRDGRRIYEGASSDLLTFYCNTIAYMDGGSQRLIGMLRRLEDSHVRLERSRIHDDSPKPFATMV